MNTEQVKPRKRGRPAGSGRHHARLAILDARTRSEAYADSIAALPQLQRAKGYDAELILKRIDELTANILDDRTLAQRFAHVTGMTERLAHSVIQGLQPFTTRMLAVCALKLGVSPTMLLMGETQAQPKVRKLSDLTEEEHELLSHYRAANTSGKVVLHFILALPRLLESLPPEISHCVIGSLIRLHDAGAQEILQCLPSVLGQYKVRTGTDPIQYIDAKLIFTPIHEQLGIFGPEFVALEKFMPQCEQ